MKKMNRIGILIILLFCSVLHYNSYSQISQGDAVDIVIEEVFDGDLGVKNLFVSRTTLAYSDSILIMDYDFIMVMPYPETWAVYIDFHPLANWFHETMYVAVNAENGEYTVYSSSGYPIDLYYYFQIAPGYIPEYEDYKEYSTDFDFSGGEAIDINSDGLSDVILHNEDHVLVLKNESGDLICMDTIDGSFLSCVDMNSDGVLEVLSRQGNDINISYFVGNSISISTSVSNDFGFTHFTCGDIDGNNEIDFVLANHYRDSMQIFLNPIDPQNYEIWYYSLSPNMDVLICEDMDDNGMDDLIFFGHVCYSFEDGFHPVPLPEYHSAHDEVFVVKDLDDDGDKDLIFEWWTDNLFAYKNLDDFQFEISYPANFIHADFTDTYVVSVRKDGYPDIVRVALDNEYIFYEDGLYLFTNPFLEDRTDSVKKYPIEILGERNRTLGVGDFDGNGYEDVVVFRIGSRPNMVDSIVGDIVFLYNDEHGNLSNDSLLSKPRLEIVSQSQCFPNPFTHSVAIPVHAEDSECLIEIFNSTGNIIHKKALKDNPLKHFVWDGVSDQNKSCPSGIYLVKITSGNNKPVHYKVIKQ